MERIGILAITKNGINIARDLKEKFSSWEIFAPDKFSDGNDEINWYTCLLYTSPSPRDYAASRMPSSA